jgi:putative addiction module component (TIGR02574 family)
MIAVHRGTVRTDMVVQPSFQAFFCTRRLTLAPRVHMLGMRSQARKILERALALPEEDRLYLVEALQESLPSESQEEIDAAWKDELARRIQSIDDGTAVLHDGETVLRELMAKYER